MQLICGHLGTKPISLFSSFFGCGPISLFFFFFLRTKIRIVFSSAQLSPHPPATTTHAQEVEPAQQAPLPSSVDEGETGPSGRLRGGGQAADANWVLFEFTSLKERMQQMERKAEALWHIQVGGWGV